MIDFNNRVYTRSFEMPPQIELEAEHKRDPIMGFNVTVYEWSDGMYTVDVSDKGDNPLGFVDTIIDGYEDSPEDQFPTDEEIQLRIEETLDERADRAMD